MSRPPPPPSLPAYRQMAALNQPIPLDSVMGECRVGPFTVIASFEFSFTWTPYPRPRVKIAATNIDHDVARFLFRNSEWPVEVHYRGQWLDVMVQNYTDRLEGDRLDLEIDGLVQHHNLGRGPFNQVRFSLANLDQYRGEWVDRGNGTKSTARLHFEAQGWRLILENHANIETLNAQRKESLGHATTHVGLLERTDAGQFDLAEAEMLLSVVMNMFSLVQGDWTPYVLPQGLDASGRITWERWYVPKGSIWESPITWFVHLYPEHLGGLFFALVSRWPDDDWNRAFQGALYWYIEIAANRTPNATLVVAQNGLEILSWYFFVTAGSEDPKTFDRLRAADRIKRLLDARGIPSDIPSSMTNLYSFAQTKNWTDGPNCTASLRNLDVHPKGAPAPNEVVKEASYLTLWHLELCLLAHCGYHGIYSNRLKLREGHEAEPVPWDPPQR